MDKVYIIWFIWDPDNKPYNKTIERIYKTAKAARSYVWDKVVRESMPRAHFKIQEIKVT
jgi:hypothetical protein